MGSKSYSKGISWIDDCRIPFVDDGDIKSATPGSLKATGEFSSFGFKSGNELNTTGRFPANLLVSDDMLNDGSTSKTTSSKGHIRKGNVIGDNRTPVAAGLFGDGNWIEGTNINDKGTNSRYYDIDGWFNNLIDV
jgi:hypothetical protein